MNDQTNMAQLRYLEELKIRQVIAGFGGAHRDQHLPVRWRITTSAEFPEGQCVLYRQENVDGIGAQDAFCRPSSMLRR